MLVTVQEFQESRYGRPSYTDAQVREALEYAEQRFYSLTNRDRYGYWLEPRALTLRVHGTGTSLLRLPYPVLVVTKVELVGADGSRQDITEAVRAHGHFLHRTDDVFPEGFANVEVEGEFGDPFYAGRPVPADVKEAVCRLAHMKLRRHRLIAGEEIEEHRPPTEPPPPPTLTGDREVDGILKTYFVAPPLGYLDLRGPID